VSLSEAAWLRHREARIEAYEAVREDAITSGGLGPELRLADIDTAALDAWERSWSRRKHSGGMGGWNWPELIRELPRRAAVLPVAIWYKADLCGLALGHASRSRAGGRRHTITVTYAERRPEPPSVPLRGYVIRIVVSAAQFYGLALGATRLLLRDPDPRLVRYYESLGFDVAWERNRPAYCVKEIRP
jgi:hypothetical protein